MAFASQKTRSRRNEIRKNRRDVSPTSLECCFDRLRDEKTLLSLSVAVAFVIVTVGILMLRPQVVAYRPGQWAPTDVLSRVDFIYRDPTLLERAREDARRAEPRVYREATRDGQTQWARLASDLYNLPEWVKGLKLEQLTGTLSETLDGATLTKLQEIAQSETETDLWRRAVDQYVASIREMNLILLPEAQRNEDVNRPIRLPGLGTIPGRQTFAADDPEAIDALARRFDHPAQAAFSSPMVAAKVVSYTLATLDPTHELDEAATLKAQQAAADLVAPEAGQIAYKPGQKIVAGGTIVNESEWNILRAENRAYRAALGNRVWAERLGLVGSVILLVTVLIGYILRFQPRIGRNPARAAGIATLLGGMLLLAQLVGLGTSSIYLLGIAPTILVAMTLCVAYDQRFAIGVAAMHAVLVTFALNQTLTFFLTIFVGIVTCCFFLDDVRTRSKLIEVGGVTGVALAVATAVAGLLRMDPFTYVLTQCVFAAAAGLGAGFVVLGVLPFIERVFHITTSMTLLEFSDQSHPVLRRMSMEAPGSYAHSLQVAAISEEAATAIGANSLLCRVASYYHDIGKLTKPDYFIENQSGGVSRHLNLNPSMSLLVIIGHVKDGVEMAKEYKLPRAFIPFIQQHHGTTLVEYFYREACVRQQQALMEAGQPSTSGDGGGSGTGGGTGGGGERSRHEKPPVAEFDYRYPGPKPRSRETAIVMLADTVESACRAMSDPTPTRIESRVSDLTNKRLLDGQFDECPITLEELDKVRRSLVKTLVGIYHGRIPYPSDDQPAQSAPAPTEALPAARPAVG